MNKHLVQLGIFTAFFSLAANSFAQEAAAEQTPAANTSTNIKPAAMSSRMLLTELQQQELALYELFNAINSTDDFDIACGSEAVAISDSIQQLCEPAFLKKIRQQVWDEQAQDTSADTGLFSRIRNAFVSKDADIEKTVRERGAASIALLQQEMESLASVNPQLAAQLQTIGQLQVAYLEQVKSYRPGGAYSLPQQGNSGAGGFFANTSDSSSRQPWLGATRPGQSQPTIHYRADISPRHRR